MFCGKVTTVKFAYVVYIIFFPIVSMENVTVKAVYAKHSRSIILRGNEKCFRRPKLPCSLEELFGKR